MNPRQKCVHCGKIAEFRDDFCTQCWCHRTKGKVLSEEQIATCQSQLAVMNDKKRWQADLGVWQNRLLIPAILMTLWCLYGVSVILPVYLKYNTGLVELAIGLLCAVSFATGGFLIGGAKALNLACALLIIACLVSTFHIAESLLEVFRGEEKINIGFLFSSIRLVFCGTIFVSSVMILRIKRPAI